MGVALAKVPIHKSIQKAAKSHSQIVPENDDHDFDWWKKETETEGQTKRSKDNK